MESQEQIKKSILEKIEVTKKQIRICNVISLAGVILTILLCGLEFISVQYFKGQGWVPSIIRLCIHALYVMPFVIVVPLFFRVNLRGKLYRLKKQEKGEE